MKKLLFVFILVVTISGFPASSYAYQATAATAVKLSDDTLLFTITSRFSYMNYSLRLPLLAKREGELGKAFPAVGYALYTETGELYTEGEATAIVLSSAELVGAEYVTPLNKAGSFTLLSILKLPKALPEGTTLYMRTTTQPYTLMKDGVLRPGQLDQGQLSTHKTPLLKL